MNNSKTILVCGSIVYDRIMNFPGKFSDHILPDKVHILNVSFTLDKMHESYGGTGGNIAYNLALLGERPKLIGVAGADFEKYADWLKQNRVDIKNVKIHQSEATASCYIMTDRSDNQITGFYGGPKDDAICRVAKKIKDVKIAIISPDAKERMLAFVKYAKQAKVPYIFDPGQQLTSLSAKELKWAIQGAKAVIGNDYEIELILSKTGLKRQGLEKLAEILIITQGEKGSEIYHQGKKISVKPAKPLKILDPTGAGDAYRAGLIKGLLRGWPLKKCGQLGALVSVYTVEKYGTQTHSFSWQELAKRYKQNFREEL